VSRPSLPFVIKAAPWWVRLLGWWRRRKFEKKDRAEKLRLQKVPVWQGVIIGKTRHVDLSEPNTFQTHRWDFYETPAGQRTVKFVRMSGYGQGKSGEDHPWHALIVTPWLHGKYRFDWAKTAKEHGSPYGWRV
jgi:hypothetical protein